MRKLIVFLLFGIVFLVSCDNAALDSEQENTSSNDTSSLTENFDYDDNESSELEEISILSDKVGLLMPKTFEIMSDEMAQIKYPTENRPTVIYTNEMGSVNVAFNHTETPMSIDYIADYCDMLVETFTNLYPSAQWYKSDVETINEVDVGVLELITPAIDTEIYNLIWFTVLDDSLLLVTFNCTMEEMTEWEPIAKSIFDSFQIK